DLVRVAGQGIAILTPAVEAVGPRIAFVNDGFSSIFACSREAVIGHTPLALGIVDSDAARFDALMLHVFENKAFDAEMTARRTDGVQSGLELALVPVLDCAELTNWFAFVRAL